eukprot:CAMPEP_0195517166 /NCGR_PEP_ID=MMETSP0794_2-20130614/10123_1 /TAXON_ID=515487 /ORGANISM="Stephanopyxis turris, Strain CCMP 815" /LENGTH=417 /DNA_ID=CAMNT_0040645931 /DNA_START=34 /DNA_END=1287 /DNA_ORIENTATION=+
MRIFAASLATLMAASSSVIAFNAPFGVSQKHRNVARVGFSLTASPSPSSSNNMTPSSLHCSAVAESFTQGLTDDYEKARAFVLDKLEASKQVPPAMWNDLVHFTNEYAMACQESQTSPEIFTSYIFKVVQRTMEFGFPSSPNFFQFESVHRAVRGPDIDFYRWGCDFFEPIVDMKNSVISGEEYLKEAFEYVEKGENVVFLANHQSEVDPQLISILFESIGMEEQALKMTYVAGHKVTTDALAIPFSMGQNLLCIHSKKHINADPETKDEKSRQNLKTMGAMTQMMKQGGACLWVAPSGGRDRRDVDTCEVPVAPFDQKTVDMFRLIGRKSKVPTHFYPMALVSYALCPPPDTLEAGVGEQRNLRFSPIGVSVGPEVQNVGGVESRHLFTEHAFEAVEENYINLLGAIQDKIESNED